MDALLLACAANVAPVTLEAVVRVESGGNPLAINVNGLNGTQPRATTLPAAIAAAESYIMRGYTVDLGLMQVNSRNLAALGYSVAEMFDPCTNLRGGGTILTANYAQAARDRGEGQVALRAALSAYNTGDFYRGFANGYVARYYGPNGVPALTDGIEQAKAGEGAARRSTPPHPLNPYTADTQVYVREALNAGDE